MKMTRRTALGVMVLLNTPNCFSQQTYPNRPITLIVPYPPGGATDPIARIYATKLTEAWSVPVIIDNRPGAGTTIGMNHVAHAQPDGYTIVMGTTSVGTNPALYKKLPYDTLKDFTYLSRAGILQIVATANPKLPIKTFKELIAYAKANPGKINYSSAGNGTITHLVGEFFRNAADVNIIHVPYKGSSAAVMAVVSGEADITFDTYFTERPFIKAGRLTPLASAGPKRMESTPQLPTIDETYPGFTAFSWMGFIGPANMPTNIVTMWSDEIQKISQMPDVKEKLAAAGVEASGSTPAEFVSSVEAEISKWNKVVNSSNIPKIE